MTDLHNPPFALGALRSPEEPTKWTLASVGAPTVYPSAIYLAYARLLAVRNQGQIGSCVGNTFEEIVRLIMWVISLGKDPSAQQEELSWRWVYAICKGLEGTKQTNADGSISDYTMYQRTATTNDGTYPALAAIVVRKYGVPLAKYFPNDVTLSADAFVLNRSLGSKASIVQALGQAAWDDAQTRKSGADLDVQVSAEGVKRALTYAKANNGAVAILREIGNTYWVGADGITTYDKAKLLPMRMHTIAVSGHEETLIGYVDITKDERAALVAKTVTVDSLIAKYPDGTPADATRTETVIFWLNHWSAQWCSTGGNSTDGGFGWEYLDVWLPKVRELRVVVAALPTPPDTFRYTFTKTLKKGDKGADVVALQHILKIEDCFDYPTFTGNYGDISVAGVTKLQEKYASEILTPLGLTHGTGNFGVATMAWANKKYGIIK